MNELTVFKNEKFGSVRVVEIKGEPWFVGKDVAEVLGYTNPNKALTDHCKGVTKRYIPHPQGNGTLEVNTIPESDIYRLIFRSKLPEAERFEDWVVKEILPSIRKHGTYSKPMSQLEMLAEMAKAAVEQEKRLAEHERKLANISMDIEERKKDAELLSKRLNNLNGVDLEGTPRAVLCKMVKAYAIKKGLTFSQAWEDFKSCFNTAYGTNIGLLITNYKRANGITVKITLPEYLEAVNRVDDGIRVADKMLNR